MNYSDLYFAISYAWSLMVIVSYRKQLHKSPTWFNLVCIVLAPIALPVWVLITSFNILKAK